MIMSGRWNCQTFNSKGESDAHECGRPRPEDSEHLPSPDPRAIVPHADNSGWMSLLLGKMLALRRIEVADLVASRDIWDLSHLNQDLPSLEAFHERIDLRTRDGETLHGEIYVPHGEGPHPAMLYLHGGGWCAGSAANERKIAMRFAAAGHVVLNLEYGLAPERPFLWAVEDCVYAARWLVRNGREFGADSGAIAIGGQSAGANLSAATVAALSDGGEALLAELDQGDLGDQEVEFATVALMSGIYSMPLLLAEPGSNVGPAELWHQAYLGGDFLRRNRHPLASPAVAPNLASFPPCYLSVGDEDSLLGQTLDMTKALAAGNTRTSVSVVAGRDHGMQFLEDAFEGVKDEMTRLRDCLIAHTNIRS